MASSPHRAVGPAVAPPRFPDPVFFPARRVHGLVETPQEETLEDSKRQESSQMKNGPPSLTRRNSVAGNILLLEHPEGTKAFLLQRKVANSPYGGSMRVGFCLKGDKPCEDGLWHVMPKESSSITTTKDPANLATRKRDHAMMENIQDRCEMVTVYIESEMHLSGTSESSTSSREQGTDNLKTEMAVLQWIAKQSKTLHLDHLWGSSYMGNDSGWICIVLSPWHSDGTLLDYCASQPSDVLGLDEAKFFLKQILQALQQLQLVGICHRSITMDTILLEGRHCRLSHFGSALRIPTTVDGTTPHLITPQPVGGLLPESLAPELWAQEAFDGYAVDMWSAGIILWKMVVSKVELFAAPVPEDFRFRDYCLEEKMKERLKPTGLPDEVVDLLEGLLRPSPASRYTLENVLGNPWLAD